MSLFSELAGRAQVIMASILNRLVMVAVILLIGLIAGRLVGKLLQRALKSLELGRFVKPLSKFSIEDLIGGAATMAIYFATAVMALDYLGINTLVASIIAIVIIAAVIGSVFLSVGNILPNLTAGIVIYTRRPLKKGDIIKYKDIQGKIVGTGLLETRVETDNKDIIFIPNSNLLREEVTIKS